MNGIGYPKNKLIVVEILRSSDSHSDGSESHIFFNAMIKEVKDATERQRLKFQKKSGQHFSSMTNTDLAFLLQELQKTLTSSTFIKTMNTKKMVRKK